METQSGPSRGHLRRVAADSGAVKHTLYTHSFQSSPRGRINLCPYASKYWR